MTEIEQWLAKLGLAEYVQLFADQRIDISVLRDLTDQDLKELGVPLGHRRKMLRALAGSRAGPSVPARGAAAPTIPRDSAERRQLTVLFCDLVGSTALSARLDPENYREVIRAYRQACAEAIAGFDGFIAQYLGDGVLIYFGYPRAHEDDAERAVRAGLEMLAAVGRLDTPAGVPLKARAGIATGLVVAGELVDETTSESHTVLGDTPNLAARLQALAEPGTIVIAAATRHLLGALFRLRTLGPVEIKGLSQAVEAWAVLGVAPSKTRYEAVHAARTVGFVGRESELERLAERQRMAWSGQGQAVLISGEAGIGKSCIAARISEQLAGEPHFELHFQCSPYNTHSALFPFIAQLERSAELKPDDAPERRLEKLSALAARARTDNAATVPLFADLLSIPSTGRYPGLVLSPAQQRRQTLAAFLDQWEGMARQQPLALFFEDAHWADATSLELLNMAIERIRRLPVLAIVTFRPEFEPPWNGLPNVIAVTLGRLEERTVRALISQRADGRTLPAEVLTQIVAKTDGIPLFVEELTKTVLESGVLVQDGTNWRLNGPLPPLAIPATLRDSLRARLDRLGPAKEIAQTGAVIGRELSYALLSAVVEREPAMLEAALGQLEEAELIVRRGDPPAAEFVFKHALVQDAAYESLLKSRRQVLHRRIAEALRDKFPERAAREPEVVAHHLNQAGLQEEAFTWWGKAGEQALRKSANVEAISHLGKALHLAESIPDSPPQRLFRLRLQVAYGQALIATRGHSAHETQAAFARARELAAGIEDSTERFSVTYGLWAASFVSGRLAPMLELGEGLLQDTQGRPESVEAGIAHRLHGSSMWFKGDYQRARPHLERAVAAYDPERDKPLAFRFGQDVGMAAMTMLAFVLWPLGAMEAAVEMAERAYATGIKSGHAQTIAYMLGNQCTFNAVCRNPARAALHAEACVRHSREHGMPQWLALGTLMLGWARWHTGDRAAGLAGLREGVALSREVRFNNLMPLQGLLAEAEAEAGNVATGLALLDDLLAETGSLGVAWFDSELERLRGELLLRRSPASGSVGSSRERSELAGAEAAFQRSLATARNQGARAFELRSAYSLAKLLQAVGRAEEARAVLTPALAGFSASPELPEIELAARLLRG